MTCLIVSCEHGGNRVPARYRPLFRDADRILATHRGYDLGAAPFARELARATQAPLYLGTVTRLLVDLNRSLGQPSLFSEFTRTLPAPERARILARYYTPHLQAVLQAVAASSARTRVLHIAVHSFTPVLGGEVRNADIGLLYAPARALERAFADRLHCALARLAPRLRVRRNYPYRGGVFGLTEWLRRQFPPRRYVGFELEFNQGLLQDRAYWAATRQALIAAITDSV